MRVMGSYQPIARTETARQRKALETLRAFCLDKELDFEVRAQLGQLLIVRAAGFLEDAMSACARCAVVRLANAEARAFGLSWCTRLPNPKADPMCKWVARFSSKWEQELRALLDTEERSASLNSLVGLRNRLAHGKQQSVSPAQAAEYCDLAIELVEWLVNRFDPLPGAKPATARGD